MWCSYYQIKVSEPQSWFVVGILRSFEHLCFDRTLDVQNSVFEFFVPEENEAIFNEIVAYCEQQGLVSEIKKLPNRLTMPGEGL